MKFFTEHTLYFETRTKHMTANKNYSFCKTFHETYAISADELPGDVVPASTSSSVHQGLGARLRHGPQVLGLLPVSDLFRQRVRILRYVVSYFKLGYFETVRFT